MGREGLTLSMSFEGVILIDLLVATGLFTLFQPSVAFRIETNHLICTANQITIFYLTYNTGVKGLFGKHHEYRPGKSYSNLWKAT